MTLGHILENEFFDLDIFWKLEVSVNGYKSFNGLELVTQASSGRFFKIINSSSLNDSGRIKVQLLEDGYICWLDLSLLNGHIHKSDSWEPTLLAAAEVESRIDLALSWIEKASLIDNKYLWGGTLGPNFDCSGLVQAAFSLQDIWLPRDAYQQEKFCETVLLSLDNLTYLKPGDLLFFGTKAICDHVAIYRGDGFYWHSSGASHGRNGIGCDQLNATYENPVSNYYRSRLRGAGRVIRCHDGITLP